MGHVSGRDDDMEKSWKFAAAAGDRRQQLLAELLAADGHEAWVVRDRGDLPALAGADALILPLPAADAAGQVTPELALEDVLDALPPGIPVFGGRVPAAAMEAARRRGIGISDYTRREEFAIANALPTAEGALGLALTEMEGTLQGSDCLVLGYGRIGKLLARRLAALGARVTVTARRPADLAWIRAEGFAALETERAGEAAGQFDLICSTVPAPVLDAAAISRVRTGALLLDLASAPGSMDLEAARRRGIRAEHALSLPARTAPRAAAACVQGCIYQMMEEHTCDRTRA